MAAQKWYVKFPADAYAIGPVEIVVDAGKKVTESKVREWARNWENIKRLPRGFECWPTK